MSLETRSLGWIYDFDFFLVVHVEIEGEVFRIISARRATQEEWKLYED
jgi:uncharacterized DUF497 family protein